MRYESTKTPMCNVGVSYESQAAADAQAAAMDAGNNRNCTGCVDCTDCSYCTGCVDSTYCTGCTGCTGCTRCTGILRWKGESRLRCLLSMGCAGLSQRTGRKSRSGVNATPSPTGMRSTTSVLLRCMGMRLPFGASLSQPSWRWLDIGRRRMSDERLPTLDDVRATACSRGVDPIRR